MYWNETIETMDTERLRALQDERLREQVRYTYDRVPFYKKMFDDAGAQPGDIRTAKDLEKLPFTSKTDLRDNYPYGLFAVPMEMIQRIHASSGTTGKATVVGYTKRDIETWAECAARSLAAAGATANDIVQVSYGYGLFTGGLGAHYGAERLGATVIPMSGGSTKRQVQLMRDFGSTPAPINSWIMGMHLESLGVRMERHCANALAVAKWLDADPRVSWVSFPGLETDKYHALAEKYMPNGTCGVISFGVPGGREKVSAFLDHLKMVSIATHVADARSCTLYPAGTTHRQLTEEQLEEAGVGIDLVRLSCGIENTADIIADLDQALAAVQ